MKKKNNYKGFFGIIALAVVLMFALVGCGEKPGGEGPSGPVKYTVTFDANGGTVSPSSVEVESGKTVTSLPTPTKTSGDTNFWGWFTKNGTGGDWGSSFTTATPVTGNIYVYARWGSSAVIQHTITFNAVGGTVSPSSKQVISGDQAGDLPIPTKSNNTFGGWYTATNGGGTVFTSATTVTGNITVYAKWTIIEAPVARVETRQLTDANWRAILTEINAVGKDVNLDLSACTRSDASTGGGLRSDGTFDPIRNFEDGKEYITSLILPNTATSIVTSSSIYTFQYFTSLDSVSASMVADIGDRAFTGCTSLSSASFPQATTIGNSAFSGCISLANVSFPQAIGIARFAFSGCISLASISFPASASIASDSSIFNEMYSPFQKCSNLVSFTLTGTGSLSVIENGKALVRNNTDLMAYPSASGNVTMNSITRIAPCAFEGCTSLTSVSFPQATTIGISAFSGCISLANVSFPQATSISVGGFQDCTSLTSVSFPQATHIGGFHGCTSLTSVSFPQAVQIFNYAFEGCTSLTSVSFPQVIYFGSYVFEGCTSLTSVSFPQATEIDSGAFSGCTNLSSVNFPAATFIGSGIFSNTGSIALTITLGTSAPFLGKGMFDNVNSAKTVTVNVPTGDNGYGEIPETYSGTDTTVNWGNGFRGGGWLDDGYQDNYGFYGSINSSITLKVEYLEE